GLAERFAQIRFTGRCLCLRLFDRRTGRQRAEVAAQEAGRALERVLGTDGAVGPDLDHELLVVGDLAQPLRIDRVGDPRDRRVGGVEWQGARRHAAGLLVEGFVATTDADAELHRDLGPRAQREEGRLGVDDLDVGLGDVRAGHRLRPAHLDADRAGLAGRHLDRELLAVQSHVGRALGAAGDRLVSALEAVDLHPRHGRAGHDVEQGAPERVADGERVALLARLGHQPAVAVGQDLPLAFARLLKRDAWHRAPVLSLLAVQLDDQLFRHRDLDVFAERQAPHEALALVGIHLEPLWGLAGACIAV